MKVGGMPLHLHQLLKKLKKKSQNNSHTCFRPPETSVTLKYDFPTGCNPWKGKLIHLNKTWEIDDMFFFVKKMCKM